MGKGILIHFLTQIFYDCDDLRRFHDNLYDLLWLIGYFVAIVDVPNGYPPVNGVDFKS